MPVDDLVKQAVLELLEDQALAVGGCVAAGDIPDPAVWRIVRALEAVGRRVLDRLDNEDRSLDSVAGLDLAPHPAIEYLLHRLKEH